jgi:hypothetical protein
VKEYAVLLLFLISSSQDSGDIKSIEFLFTNLENHFKNSIDGIKNNSKYNFISMNFSFKVLKIDI